MRIYKDIAVYLTIAGLLLYYFFLLGPHLSDNLWNDEIYTLKKFTFVSLLTTVTDYHVPNNHVFYNLCDNIYIRLTGINQMALVMEHPWLLRLPLLLLSILTLIYTYKLARLNGSRFTGLFAVLVLLTTIPFQNFAVQLRGYSLSMLFDTALVFYMLHFLQTERRRDLIFVLLACWFAIYTIPSNLYCALGLMFFLAVELAWQKLKTKGQLKNYFLSGGAVMGGILLAVLCYLPVFKQVTGNDYVKGVSPAGVSHFQQVALSITEEFISGRELLPLIFFIGFIAYLATMNRRSGGGQNIVFRALIFQLVTPPLLIFIRGERPPDRIFVYALPILAVLFAIVVVGSIQMVHRPMVRYSLLAVLIVVKLSVHYLHERQMDITMQECLEKEQRIQNIYCNYYQHNYHPLQLMHFLQKTNAGDKTPIVYRDSEPHDIPDYLQAFQVPYYSDDSIDNLLDAHQKIYLITRNPGDFNDSVCKRFQCKVEPAFIPDYNHLLLLSRAR